MGTIRSVTKKTMYQGEVKTFSFNGKNVAGTAYDLTGCTLTFVFVVENRVFFRKVCTVSEPTSGVATVKFSAPTDVVIEEMIGMLYVVHVDYTIIKKVFTITIERSPSLV